MSDSAGKMEWQSLPECGTLPTQKEEMASKDGKSKQIRNSEGGFVWSVNDMMRVMRFLCLGTENGTYYVKAKDKAMLTRENAACIDRLIQSQRGVELVRLLRTFSVNGRCVKQKPILYALAMCARSNDLETKRAAYQILSEVCRIPTHLFEFISNCETLSSGTGWGRAHRRAICRWYMNYANDPKKLALHVTKYRSRNQWSHKDVLRLAHIKPSTLSKPLAFILCYIIKGLSDAQNTYVGPNEALQDLGPVVGFLTAVEEGRHCSDENRMVELISRNRLVREHIPTPLLKSVPVWQALLEDMPITALIRNLGKMTSIGLFPAGSENESLVVRKLGNLELLKQGRVHPFSVLLALKTYEQGHGDKGTLQWSKNGNIIQALDSAFYLAFKAVVPTNKRFLLAVDVSGSMCVPVMGASAITARDASAAMMMVVTRTEVDFEVMAFCHQMTPLNVRAHDSLNDVLTKIRYLDFGATDCSLPMMYALQNKKEFDVFVVYTDCETYYGKIHPTEALRQYRIASNIHDARLIVVGMTSNGFTIADPDDRYMLDVVGFDSEAPEAMTKFVEGAMDIDADMNSKQT